eukprot:2615641-Amphidinium_carterae.2
MSRTPSWHAGIASWYRLLSHLARAEGVVYWEGQSAYTMTVVCQDVHRHQCACDCSVPFLPRGTQSPMAGGRCGSRLSYLCVPLPLSATATLKNVLHSDSATQGQENGKSSLTIIAQCTNGPQQFRLPGRQSARGTRRGETAAVWPTGSFVAHSGSFRPQGSFRARWLLLPNIAGLLGTNALLGLPALLASPGLLGEQGVEKSMAGVEGVVHAI